MNPNDTTHAEHREGPLPSNVERPLRPDLPGTGSGLILGKFLPPHAGHRYLVDFARGYGAELTVLVCSLRRDPIPGTLRAAWMRELFPDARVVHVTDENPQEPHEHPRFWDIWHDTIRRAVPTGPDWLFASEGYGQQLAEMLGARFVAVDRARELVPVSGARLRADPMGLWEHLPGCVRPWFARRVCVFGPESTGKSTLAKRLAAHYRSAFVHEYARGYIDNQDGRCELADIPYVARGQIAAEEARARQADRVRVCDTSLITTVMWSEILYGGCPQWVRDAADRRRYDLYLLTDLDVPWVHDPQRCQPELAERQRFLARCVRELESRGLPYVKISGPWEQRFAKACAAVDALPVTRTLA